MRLENCTMIDGHYFIQFGNSPKVKEIVLGCKYDNSEEYILKLSKDLSAKVIPSRMALEEYKMNIDGRKIKKFQ